MNKIVVKGPVVELDGDEMTRIIWKKIREEVSILYFIVILQEMFQLPVCASTFAS
jgi:isocitrate dehydrogenase